MSEQEAKKTQAEVEAEAADDWLKYLHEYKPGYRAELRRIADPRDAVYCQGFWLLRHYLRGAAGISEHDLRSDEWLPYLAALLAHQKQHNPDISLPKAMGQSEEGSRAKVSRQRFRRLLENDTRDDLFHNLLRTLSVFKGHLNFTDLFELLRYWPQGWVKRKWAIAYFQDQKKENL